MWSRWQSRRTCPHLLLWELQNYNLLLSNHKQENVGSHQERYPTSKGKGEAPARQWSRSVVSNSLQPHGHQAPLSMGFSRQEYWSGLPFPSPGNFPTQGSNPGLPHCRQTLYRLSHQGSHFALNAIIIIIDLSGLCQYYWLGEKVSLLP